MIVVKIELHSAITGKIKKIGEMRISNIGGTKRRGDYAAKVARRGSWPGWYNDPSKFMREGSVKNYPRLSYNVWRLVIRSLLSCFPEEHPK